MTRDQLAQAGNLEHWPIVNRTDTAIFLRLPVALQRKIGRCDCPFCKAHPGRVPMWDTLGVSLESQDAKNATWTVHAPDWN